MDRIYAEGSTLLLEMIHAAVIVIQNIKFHFMGMGLLVGQKAVLFMAIHRNEISRRNTSLGERICLYYRAFAKSAGIVIPAALEEKLKNAG